MVRVDAGVVEPDPTGAGGVHEFRKRVNATTRCRVKVAGKVLNAVHPHNVVCEGSTPDTIRVRVA